MRAIYDKPTANMIVNGENLEAIPVKSERRQDCPPFPFLFKIVLEALARAIREEKEIKEIQTEKSQIICICRWYNITHKRWQTLQPKLLEMIKTYTKVIRYKINL